MRETAEIYGFTPDRHSFICCPFHGEKTASMRLYEDYFHCFGCGAHGDIINFVQRLKNTGALEAAKELADITGISYSQQRKTAPVRNSPTRSELLRYYADWEARAFRTLNNYFKLLQQFYNDFKPCDSADKLHPLFIKALHELEYVHSLCMLFISGSAEDRKLFYINRKEVLHDFELQYRKYTGA